MWNAPSLRSPPKRWTRWVGLLCAFWCSAAGALSLDGTFADMKHTAWGSREGAPTGVLSMAQTRDGYLWLSSPAGLFRFDGLHFERVELPRDPRLSSSAVYVLFAPQSGGLWIGFTFGGAAFLKDGKLTIYGEAEGLPPGTIKSFAVQQNGTVWAGGSSGLARFDGRRWLQVGVEAGFSDTQNDALMIDSAETLWAASRNEVLFLPRGEKRFRQSEVHALGREFTLAESAKGTVWLWSDKQLQRLAQNDRGGKAHSSGGWVLFDHGGSLWTGGESRGVARISGSDMGSNERLIDVAQARVWFGKKEGLSDFASRRILEDAEGNIWISTDQGIDRFSARRVYRGFPAEVEEVLKGEGEPSRDKSVVAGSAGSLWIGGFFPLFRAWDGRAEVHPEVHGVSCAAAFADGSIWFGGPASLWRYASGQFDRTGLPPDTDGFDVQAMAQQRSGALWISIVRKGVFRLANGTWTAYGGLPTLPHTSAIALSTDAKGRVWFGYTGGRIAVLDAGVVTVFPASDPASIGNVTAIFGQRKHIWAGGELGLALFDGNHFVSLRSQEKGAFSDVTGIVESANGELWLNSHIGIVHLAAAEVDRLAAAPATNAQVEIFDALDDVQGTSARLRPLPTAIEGSDDRIWFLRDTDSYSVVPASLRRNRIAPPVVIQGLTAGDKFYSARDRITLPQRTTALRIDYAGLSLTSAEKVRYRYRLDDVDPDWQDAGGRRQAFYTNLAPGPHHFRVVAANNDGVWNDVGAAIEFVIPPAFVQTVWFAALCAAGTLVVTGLLVLARFRQLSARIRVRYEERMAERERIARELHDTLLQGTQALVLKVQAASTRIRNDEPAHAMLEEALTRADEVMAEGRDRIQDLRIPAQANSDLPEALAAVGSQLARGREVAFQVLVEGGRRELKSLVRDEAYQIGREALLNAFRHAQAKAIEVQIVFADDLRMRVRDDGVGIDARALEGGPPAGHWGLQGMRERGNRTGADIEIWSRPGGGTEIELRISGTRAYADRSVIAPWLSFLWRLGP
jgi:signal transduction histidine kinase/ligand-binding sensor domain-containing protein